MEYKLACDEDGSRAMSREQLAKGGQGDSLRRNVVFAPGNDLEHQRFVTPLLLQFGKGRCTYGRIALASGFTSRMRMSGTDVAMTTKTWRPAVKKGVITFLTAS